MSTEELIAKLEYALASVKCDMYDLKPLEEDVCIEVEQALALIEEWRKG